MAGTPTSDSGHLRKIGYACSFFIQVERCKFLICHHGRSMTMLKDLSVSYLVIHLHADIHCSGQPFVSVVLFLSPNCRQLSGRCSSSEPQLVHVESVHVVAERDAVGSSAVQARHSDAATAERVIS